MIAVASDIDAATELQFGAFGIAIVSDAARAAGIASLPTPITEANTDFWQTWQPFLRKLVVKTAVGIEPNFMFQYDIDSKAMRKIKPGDAIVLVVENSASTGIEFAAHLRLLFKYH